MNSFIFFTYKELSEQVKTYKGLVIAVVLLIFGMTSPLLAKLTPDMLKMAGLGASLQIPAPTYLDAYAQFFKNIGQMVLIVLMFVYAGSISGEVTKGTAALMLTKRLSRGGFVLAKFLSAVAVWTVSYAVSAAVCIFYTVYLFPAGKPEHLFLSLACMWLFGVLTLAMALFASALFKSYALAAVTGFLIWGLTLAVSAIPKVGNYAPAYGGSANMQLIGGGLAPEKMLWPVITAAAFTVLLVSAACLIFRRREL